MVPKWMHRPIVLVVGTCPSPKIENKKIDKKMTTKDKDDKNNETKTITSKRLQLTCMPWLAKLERLFRSINQQQHPAWDLCQFLARES
jgi:preprotein translocase subunit Sec63